MKPQIKEPDTGGLKWPESGRRPVGEGDLPGMPLKCNKPCGGKKPEGPRIPLHRGPEDKPVPIFAGPDDKPIPIPIGFEGGPGGPQDDGKGLKDPHDGGGGCKKPRIGAPMKPQIKEPIEIGDIRGQGKDEYPTEILMGPGGPQDPGTPLPPYPGWKWPTGGGGGIVGKEKPKGGG